MRTFPSALAGAMFAASVSAAVPAIVSAAAPAAAQVGAAKPATWIWYPGDFEIWLSNQVQVRRVERDAPFMPFWRFYGHQQQVNFSKQFELAVADEITVTAEGRYSVLLDGKDQKQIRVSSPGGKGVLRFASAAVPRSSGGEIRKRSPGQYELALEPGKSYVVNY